MTETPSLKIMYPQVTRRLSRMQPELRFAYEELSQECKAMIVHQAAMLMVSIYQLGPLGALELLYKLGRFKNTQGDQDMI